MKQARFNEAHMRAAMVYGELSFCRRRQVGALLVSSDNRPLLSGYNGTSPGRDNCCEGEDGATLNQVHHAEANLICNAAKNGIATKGCTMFITTSPCISCAKLIEAAGITKVYFKDLYKDSSGIDYLDGAGIHISQL
jgi:dCMP deaminase